MLDTLEGRPEARLAQPATPVPESAASASYVGSQWHFKPSCVSDKRYGSRGSIVSWESASRVSLQLDAAAQVPVGA